MFITIVLLIVTVGLMLLKGLIENQVMHNLIGAVACFVLSVSCAVLMGTQSVLDPTLAILAAAFGAMVLFYLIRTRLNITMESRVRQL